MRKLVRLVVGAAVLTGSAIVVPSGAAQAGPCDLGSDEGPMCIDTSPSRCPDPGDVFVSVASPLGQPIQECTR